VRAATGESVVRNSWGAGWGRWEKGCGKELFGGGFTELDFADRVFEGAVVGARTAWVAVLADG